MKRKCSAQPACNQDATVCWRWPDFFSRIGSSLAEREIVVSCAPCAESAKELSLQHGHRLAVFDLDTILDMSVEERKQTFDSAERLGGQWRAVPIQSKKADDWDVRDED